MELQPGDATSEVIIEPPTVPRANWLDVVRIMRAALAYGTAAGLRRAVGRKRRPAWSLSFETWVAAARGAWSVMPCIGVVRWRNATEVVSPLKMDGVSPPAWALIRSRRSRSRSS